MTLQSSGAISIANIQTEFGGTYSLSDYYRGGSYVANVPALSNIPTSGAISLFNFYGLSRWQIYNLDVYGTEININLFNRAMAAGMNNSLPIAVRVNVYSGAIVGSNSTDQYALITGDGWGVTPDIVITVHSGGFITGAGGYGASARGGPALALTQSTLLYNYGIIQAGGGGGQGGQQGICGGGAGYYAGSGINNQDYVSGGEGPLGGTLEQGGSYADDDSEKSGGVNGGAGGGWVARPPYNYSTNGYGYGATPANFNYFDLPNQGGAPGRAITNSYLLRSGSYNGTLRGFIDLDPGYYNYRCVGFDQRADYYNGYGGWAYDQLVQANSPSCGYVDPGVGVDSVGSVAPICCCFTADTLVQTPEGFKPIKSIQVDDLVISGSGSVTRVQGLILPSLDHRPLYRVDGQGVTGDHLFKTAQGWACVDPARYRATRWNRVIDIQGSAVNLGSVDPDSIEQLSVGTWVITDQGQTQIQQVEQVIEPDCSQIVYSLVTKSGDYALASGHVVDGIPQSTGACLSKYITDVVLYY